MFTIKTNVHCTVYSVHCIHCTMYNVYCKVYIAMYKSIHVYCMLYVC